VGVIVDGEIVFKNDTEAIYEKFQNLMSIYEIIFPKNNFEDVIELLEENDDKVFSFKIISNNKIIVETKNDDFDFPPFVEKRRLTPNLEDVYSYIVKKDKIT
jgi:hypothetical protein